MKNKKIVPFKQKYNFYVDGGLKAASEGNYFKALKYLFAANDKKPSDITVLTHIAIVYQKMGLYEASNSVLFKILSLDKVNEGACILLGQNYSLMGDSLHELYYLKNFSEISEDFDFSELFDGSFNVPHFEQVYPLPKHLCEALKQRGAKMLADGRIKEAAECFNEILDSHPDDAFSKNHLCQILIINGKLAQAVELAKENILANKKDVFAWCNLAMALNFLGNTSQMNDAVDHIETLDVCGAEDLKRVIKILSLSSRHRGAMNAAEKYLKEFPYDSDYLSFCGAAAYNCGEFEKAKDCFLKIDVIFPETQVIKYHLELVQSALDGNKVCDLLPYDLKMPAEEEEKTRDYLRRTDYSDIWTNKQKERYVSWAFNNEETELSLFILDELIQIDKSKTKKVMKNLLVQDYGWQMKSMVLEKFIEFFPKEEIFICKDGYFMPLEMPKKKIPQKNALAFWKVFCVLSVLFVEEENWIDKIVFASSSLECRTDFLKENGFSDREIAALILRVAKLADFGEPQICALFKITYQRLAEITQYVFD